MRLERRIERAEERLADIRREQRRQIEFAGERLGVFKRLRELERDERRTLKLLQTLGSLSHGPNQGLVREPGIRSAMKRGEF